MKYATAWALLDNKGLFLNKRAYVNFSKDLIIKRYKENNPDKDLDYLLRTEVLSMRELLLEVQETPVEDPKEKTEERIQNMFFVAVTDKGEVLNYSVQSSPLKTLKCLKKECLIYPALVITRPSVVKSKLRELRQEGVETVATDLQKAVVSALYNYETALCKRDIRVMFNLSVENEDEVLDVLALKLLEIEHVLTESLPTQSWVGRVHINKEKGELIVATTDTSLRQRSR